MGIQLGNCCLEFPLRTLAEKLAQKIGLDISLDISLRLLPEKLSLDAVAEKFSLDVKLGTLAWNF